MPIIHDDHQRDGYIYNSDRNNQMFMGPSGPNAGQICWNSAYQMTWDGPIYLSWFGERLWGSAKYNQIPASASPVVIPVDCVMYVMLDPDTDGQNLTPIVVSGAFLPHGDNVLVIASHKDIGLTPSNPLVLMNNVSIPIDTCWSQTIGLSTGWWAGNFNSQVWNAFHNLHTTDVDIVIQDANNPRQQIVPEKIEMIDIDNVRITFGEVVAGRLLIHIAGKVMTVPVGPAFYFINLLDCPPAYGGHANKAVTVKSTEDGLEFTTIATPVYTFIDLTDTPASYPAGSGSVERKYPIINATDNGLDFGYGYAVYAPYP